MTDFQISKWGRYFLLYANTERARDWLVNHWRSPADPPSGRATKVARLMAEIVYWWDHYEPTYTVTMAPDVAQELETAGRIL